MITVTSANMSFPIAMLPQREASLGLWADALTTYMSELGRDIPVAEVDHPCAKFCKHHHSKS